MEPKKPSCGSGEPANGADTTAPTGESSGQATDRPTQDAVFPSGAKRSMKMPYYSAIPRQSLRRLALRATGAPRGETLTDAETGFIQEGGSDKYGYGNWAKGLEFEDTFNHVIDHLYRWKAAIEEGKMSADDDLAGAAWGIMLPLMTFEKTYIYQFMVRRQYAVSEGTPEAVDVMMKDNGYGLIKPLSPMLPSRQPIPAGPYITFDAPGSRICECGARVWRNDYGWECDAAGKVHTHKMNSVVNGCGAIPNRVTYAL